MGPGRSKPSGWTPANSNVKGMVREGQIMKVLSWMKIRPKVLITSETNLASNLLS